jgi:aspartate kinase
MSAEQVENGNVVPQWPRPVVMKFGGTSVEDAAAFRRVVQLVKQRLRARPVLVVSALAQVTDQLLEAGKAAAQGGLAGALAAVDKLAARHEQVALEVVSERPRRCLADLLAADVQLLRQLLHEAHTSRALSPRLQDHLLGLGECMASRLLHAALESSGAGAAWVDARTCVVTDAAHTQATPLWDETNAQVQAAVLPHLAEGRIVVLGGFVGATRDGIPTTLGRGGSDFSAAIVGAALHASRIEIWTDVDGILTTDPKLCPEAQRVARMSFEEAADLAYFGARVLHPATIAPAMRKNIPVWVLNSRKPDGPGTEIVAQAGDDDACSVKAVSVKKGIAVVDVEAVRWLAPELLREIFEVFERHQHALDLLSANRGSLSLLVNSTASLPSIAEELKGLAQVRWQNHKALVCLVGERVRRQPEIAAQVFRTLADVDLRLICQGASERNISFLVDESKAEESVRRLHRLFFAGPLEQAAGDPLPYPMCQAGGAWQ